MTKNNKKKFQKKQNKNVQIRDKTFDISRFKSEMTKEMCDTIKQSIPLSSFNSSSYQSYEKMHAKYITEVFQSRILTIINQICSQSKTLPDELRNNYPIHSLLVKITRELMLNELELVYLSLYFDSFGWSNNNIDIMDNFVITALSVKKYLNEDIDEIENYLSKAYPEITNKFNLWIKNQSDFRGGIMITPRKVNQRYNELHKPYNTFCKNNYIDYNESVDRILQMSLPYNEGGKQSTNVIIAEKVEEDRKEIKRGKISKKSQNDKNLKKNFIIIEKKNLLKNKKEKSPKNTNLILPDFSTNEIHKSIFFVNENKNKNDFGDTNQDQDDNKSKKNNTSNISLDEG